jgi:dihydrofolate reductase
MLTRLSIIVAVSQNGVIGKNDRLPWHIPEDFAWFKRHTEGHTVVMGRKTYESIGGSLPGRKNVIITRNRNYRAPGAHIFHSLDDALATLKKENHREVFIIGGQQIFSEVMDRVDRIYLTRVHRDYDGDTYMPLMHEDQFKLVFEEKHRGEVSFTFLIYDRIDERKESPGDPTTSSRGS